jgi:hypothetical protein
MTEFNSEMFMTRAEFETCFESLRRELSGYAKGSAELRTELSTKLDEILRTKTEDARAMGKLEEKVDQLGRDVRKQGDEIAEIRRQQEEPKDAVLRWLFDLFKLFIAGIFGYALSKLGPILARLTH